jgi:hypothetical protein
MFSVSLGSNDEEVDKPAFPRRLFFDIALATPTENIP